MLQLFRKRLSNRKGFTLVELLVVIAIIGILAAIAVPKFTDASASARGAKVVADLRTIDSASAIYNAQNGSYTDIAGLVTANLLASAPTPLNAGETFTTPSGSNTSAGTYSIGTNGRALYITKTADDFSKKPTTTTP